MKRAPFALLCLAILASACLAQGTPKVAETAGPTIEILSPPSGARVILGEELEIESGSADARGIQRVELWIDQGIYRIDEAASQPSFRVIQRWRADVLGTHEIMVKAVSVDAQTSQPFAISVEVVERAPATDTPEPAPGPTETSTAVPVPSPTDTQAPPEATPTATTGPESPTATTTPTATVEPTPTTAPAPQEMVSVPAGTFLMGSNQDHVQQATDWCQCGRENFEDELYMHEVYVSAFYIDKYEVTNASFLAFVQATGYQTEAERKPEANTWRTAFTPGKESHPVVWMSWHDAQAYCEWAGKRLPTEAEWEKAARGTDARLWPWGNNWENGRLNMRDGGRKTTTPVGSFSNGASPYGAMDMAGNVWEWVQDWYGYWYYQEGVDRDPLGPTGGQDRVLRGGGFNNGIQDTRTANRHKGGMAGYAPDHGFRCASSAQ